MVDPNTRQGKRTPVTLKIKFKSETLEQFIERYAVDVSQGGIFIRTKEPLAVGTQMKFEFQLRDASPLIGGEGTVVWTRENDPTRPAIAPGMGVRFDRLADGSQSVLERILAEKAKQAPQRAPDTTKPPMFTDVPTRVAPPPVQDALLGTEAKRRSRADSYNDQHTPLPKPMPFHSDADEFPEEAFEEATKVRALDELIAATADQGGDSKQLEELAARRARTVDTGAHPTASEALAQSGAGNTAVGIPPMPPMITTPASGPVYAPAPPMPPMPQPAAAAPFANSPFAERDSAPILPSPPERASPKLLDTSPSPRQMDGSHHSGPVMGNVGGTMLGGEPAKTRLGLEPARVHSPSVPPPNIREAPTRPSGMRAVAAEQTSPTRVAKRSNATLIVLLILLFAAGGAAVWWFVIRPRAQEAAQRDQNGSGSAAVVQNGSRSAGSAAVVQNGSNGSGSAGSAAVQSPPPSAEVVDTIVGSSIEKSTVAIVGTDQTGPAPFTAKLEKGKAYKARVTAPGYLAQELDVNGGDAKSTAKLVAKPHVISVTSDPPGALIFIDGAPAGHSTPFDVELSKAQAAKKVVHVQLHKAGYKVADKVIDASSYSESDDSLVAKLDQKLTVAPAQVPLQPMPHPDAGVGTGSGSAEQGSAGPVTAPEGSGSGSAAPTPPPTPPTPPPAAGSAAVQDTSQPQKPPSGDPEPDFTKSK